MAFDFSHTAPERSKIMKAIKRKDTQVELLLRKALYKRGIRYRIDYGKLPGRPDIAVTSKRIAIFCDSEFWHGRNWEEKKEKIFQCDYLKVDWEKHQVSIDGKEVHLTPMEYKILKLLIDNRGKVLTHNYILSQIWGSAQGVEAANLRVFMAALRRKIEKDPGNCRFILTEIGVGYRFREATE